MSPSRSPPQTPSKRNFAIVNENINDTPRTPRPGCPINNKVEPPTTAEFIKEHLESTGFKGSEIRIPSSNPRDRAGNLDKQQTHGSDSASKQDQVHLDNRPEMFEKGNNHVRGKSLAENSNAELAAIDWDEFETRYMEQLVALDKTELDLVNEFSSLYQSFTIWANAAADADHVRGWKRLKTRERFVQLSEQKLDDKKKHYTEVVDAFKRALDLLSQ
ncbi:hypothetical protein B0O99DRAFT_685740 [Bisporella sp. PMI_857]|nr:hypothetical protein B0O99DRAFT_685740 [Bisporella sp. PMI_857]